ncbi:hypothetical protein MASR2M74_25990 [Paracoccaceae bacterium]
MADGSAAEAAYQKALREIERVRAGGGTELDLSGEAFADLYSIPPKVKEIAGLVSLNLDGTRVSDLSPLRGLMDLRSLSLAQTAVRDLSPVRDLNLLSDHAEFSDMHQLHGLSGGLQDLSLDQNAAIDLSSLLDLSSLRDLAALQRLSFGQAADGISKPTGPLPFPASAQYFGLRFSDIPATAHDTELNRLSQIEDDEQRTRETLAYLKTLPPWPEPLPWELAEVEREVPQDKAAPLQVIEVEGVLRPYVPPQGLPEVSADLASQGWAAVRDFLSDLATIRPRIDNQVPNLARALGRFESALGASFDQVNAIALGTHGQRVIRMAASAGETLSPDDAAELQEFAAAIALYLERFPTWRAYRREALERPLTGDDVRRALPLVAEVEQAIDDRIGIDPAIPRTLRDLRHAAQEEPADSVVGHGLLDSLGNVLSALARGLWSTANASGRGLIWYGKKLGEKAADKSADVIVGTVFSKPFLVAAAELFLNKGQTLTAIATTFPEQFGWILNILRAWGLA